MSLTLALAVKLTSQPAPIAAKPTSVRAVIGPCSFTDATKPLFENLAANFINFYNANAPILIAVCLVVAILMAVFSSRGGGKWFGRAALLLGGLVLLASVLTVTGGVGPKSAC